MVIFQRPGMLVCNEEYAELSAEEVMGFSRHHWQVEMFSAGLNAWLCAAKKAK